MTLARNERRALVSTMTGAGPDAPTLCTGWTVRDLAAHLVVREGRPDAMPGIVLRSLAGHTAAVQARAAARPWDALLRRLADGPPWWSPVRPLDRFVNGVELFVHHEDVRRAAPGWEPRVLSTDDTATLRSSVRLAARKLARSGTAVTVADVDGRELARVGRGPVVRLSGAPGELLLFLGGRDEARVALEGEDAAVAAVRSSDRAM